MLRKSYRCWIQLTLCRKAVDMPARLVNPLPSDKGLVTINLGGNAMKRFLFCLLAIATLQAASADDRDIFINIAVYDFATVDVYAKYYQQQRIASPINLKSDPILTHEEIASLPPEKVAEIKQRELEERIARRSKAQQLAVRRYNQDESRRESVRQAMLGTPFGRTALEGTTLIEAELVKFSDLFAVVSRKQGQESAQQESALVDDQSTVLNGNVAPDYRLEARISPIAEDEHKILTQGSSIRSRKYTLTTTLTLFEMNSNRIKFTDVFTESKMVRALGRDFPDKSTVIRELLQTTCQKAAAAIYDEFMCDVTIRVRKPKGVDDFDIGEVDLEIVDGPDVDDVDEDEGEYTAKVRRGVPYVFLAEGEDEDGTEYVARDEETFKRGKDKVSLRLKPKYITLTLSISAEGEDFDPEDVETSLIPQEGEDIDEHDGLEGPGPHDDKIEPGNYTLLVKAEGHEPFSKKCRWKEGGAERERIQLKQLASVDEDVDEGEE
ncbi:MAG: hypothetical protein ACI96M_000390 [Candidatus Azotimanducaceae bacterium]|jgi:hypothetical protein